MILAEPPPTQGDIHFRIFGTPVRISPFFWLVALILGLQGGSTPPLEVLTWIAAMVVSILVHELGHVYLQRRYGGQPRIVLHQFGGLAIANVEDRSSRAQILISLAGPVAGFLFAVAIAILVRVTGHQIGVIWQGWLTREMISGLQKPDALSMLGFALYWEQPKSPIVNELLSDLLWINIMWGILNLLPIYPLDGGQISREVCQLADPSRGLVLSLQISMFTAGAMAVVGLYWQSLFTVLMFGMFAYSSYKTLEAYRASRW